MGWGGREKSECNQSLLLLTLFCEYGKKGLGLGCRMARVIVVGGRNSGSWRSLWNDERSCNEESLNLLFCGLLQASRSEVCPRVRLTLEFFLTDWADVICDKTFMNICDIVGFLGGGPQGALY